MNTDLLRRIADAIEAEPHRFDFSDWYHWSTAPDDAEVLNEAEAFARGECGTTACIAGWAVYLKGETPKYWAVEHRAQALLDLTTDEAKTLFFAPSDFWASGSDISAAEAARTLRGLADGALSLTAVQS